MAGRALPRLVAVLVGAGLLTSDHLLLLTIGVLVLVGAVLTNWGRWARYVWTGQRASVEPPAEFVQPGPYRVDLVQVGDRPIDVVKALREVTPSGFAAAKLLAGSVPSVVAADLSAASARLVSERVERAGGVASVGFEPGRAAQESPDLPR